MGPERPPLNVAVTGALRLLVSVKVLLSSAVLTLLVITAWAAVPEVVVGSRDAVVVAVCWLFATTFTFTRRP